MCGIVGYVGERPATPLLVQGLERLEYRGYDAAGLAVHDGKKLRTIRAVGKVAKLKEKLMSDAPQGTSGIAHTRWTTHGSPDKEENAHPHRDRSGRISLVHNGTLDNDRELRCELERLGHRFFSETDSEIIAHLFEEELKVPGREEVEAFAATLRRLRGTYGVVVLREWAPRELLVARFGSPMVIGFGEGEVLVASDPSPLIGYAKQMLYLEEGEYAAVSPDHFDLRSLAGYASVKGRVEELDVTVEEAQKGGHPHFMLAEMLDQGNAIRRVLRGRLDRDDGNAVLPELAPLEARLRDIDRVVVIACGSSYYAGQLGEQYIEELAGLPTKVDIASEFRYRTPPITSSVLVVVVSQSGETMDTMLAMQEAKRRGACVLSIVNKVGTAIPRGSDAVIYTHSGPETGVASTKAFLSQCVALLLLAVHLGRARSLSLVRGRVLVEGLAQIPEQIDAICGLRGQMSDIASDLSGATNLLYLGRRFSVPAAMEGALKLKEVTYIHAEGYPAGEMKHGPLAMLDPGFPCVIIAPCDAVYEKTRGNVSELDSRSVPLVVLTTEGNHDFDEIARSVVFLPKVDDMLTSLLAVVPLQFLAYEVAIRKGYDPDKPRNLAKTVTTE